LRPVAAANHYELLQIAPEASPQELRQAFRRLSKHYHPDTTALPEVQAREGFRRLQAAYLTLSDPERRRAYDASLAVVLPRPSLTRTVVVPVPARRALSGGEWFALLLLGLAVVFSLVLGVGLAWARGTELLREPSWWPAGEQTALSSPITTADDVPAVAPGADLQPSAAGAGAVAE
jgi:curved DNA-binding protein CbpA